MNWTQIAFGLTDALSIALIFRLVTLRLHNVYRVFCAFLFFQTLTATITFVERFSQLDNFLDYRLTWLIMRVGSWTLSIWMVYALLQAILENLPGILRFSKKVLSIILPVSLVVALISAGPEYLASGATEVRVPIDFAVMLAFILERAVSTVALLTLLLMLFFILWFPVRMPRNLALFSLGFILYFSAKTSLLLLRSFWSHESFGVVDLGVSVILCICLTYWISSINKSGEIAPVVLGHSWRSAKQSKLLEDLEAVNASLARAGRR